QWRARRRTVWHVDRKRATLSRRTTIGPECRAGSPRCATMLICRADDGIELRLLERRHVAAVESMEPGDLSFSHGEWLFPAGECAEWIEASLAEFAQGTRLEAGIFGG